MHTLAVRSDGPFSATAPKAPPKISASGRASIGNRNNFLISLFLACRI